MATPRGLVHVPFAAGLREDQQAEVLDAGQGFTTLENVRQDRRGALTKRLGYAELNTSLSAAYRVIPYGKRLLVHNSSGLQRFDDTMGFTDRLDRACTCTVEHMWIPSPAEQVQVYDVEVVGSYLAVCWSEVPGRSSAYNIEVKILDLATGSVVDMFSGYGASSTPTYALLASYGTKLFLVIADGPNNDIWVKYIDLASASTINASWTTLTGAALKTDLSNTAVPARIAVQGLTDRIAVAYVNSSAGTDRATVFTLDTTGVLETQTINTSSTRPKAIDVSGSQSDTLWVTWDEGTDVKAIGLTPASLSTTLATTATVLTSSTPAEGRLYVIESATAGSAVVLATVSGTPYQTNYVEITTSAGAVSAGSQLTAYSTVLTGSPARYGGRYYVPGYYANTSGKNDQQTVFLLNFETPGGPMPVVANPMPYLSIGTYPKSKVATSGTSLLFAMGVRRSSTADASLVAKCNFAATNRAMYAVSDGGALYLTGGTTCVFDGVFVTEAGFLVSPCKPTTSTSGTGITAATGWTYLAIWERHTASGDWVVSGVSPPSASTGAVANKTVNVTVASLTMLGPTDAAYGSVRVRFYRTADGNSPPFYSVGSVMNDPEAATISIADRVSDATLTARATLYAPNNVGGVGAPLDRRAPPCFQAVVSYNGMIVGASGSTLWYSGDNVVGEATWFSPVFQLPFADPITALAVQDGSLYVFTRTSAHIVAGEYPSTNGASGGLGTPRRLAVDVGCVDPRSVAVTSLGIFFQSERGIELMTRAQSVEWIGEPVQATIASYPVITAATLDSAASLVRFECAESETSNVVGTTGVCLVYDLTLRAWVSVDKITGEFAAELKPAQSACMAYVNDAWRYVRVDSSGTVYYERSASDASAHLDGSAWVTMLAETAWFKLGGIQGNHAINRVQWLARKSTRANLLMAVAYDYSGTYKTAATWLANTIDTLATNIGRTQLEHPMHDESEGVAVRFKFYDASPTGGTVSTGKGSTWIALTLEGTAREGTTVLPESSR